MKTKNLLTKITLGLLFIVASSQVSFAQNWQLAWSDEFNYTGLPDAGKWGYDVGGGGWGNGELQYYSNARQENSRVENGNLVLEARRDWAGAEYSSARLVSRNKGDWTYGRMEIRAKIPVGQGLWPAIWMLPTDYAYGGWPASGEIDIMESFALGGVKYDKVEANIHTQAYNHTIGTNRGAAITGLSNIEQNFHVYTVTWTANKMVFDVDGKEYFTFNNEGTWQKWPYDKRFHLIMNIAVGGALGTWVDPNIFPKRMEVDYVRVYQDGPSFQPSTDVVTAYKDCNYGGFSGGLTIGDYSLAKLKSLGMQDNDISSLRVAQGYKAILYQDDNFGGASTEINSDNTCLNTTWNDKVTSVRILANGATNVAGAYFLQNRNSGLFMDIVGGEGSVGDGVKIQQWNTAATNNQLFDFTHLGDGLYKVVARNSGKSLDVDAAKKDNGIVMQQWTYTGAAQQQFIVFPTGDGFYKLIPRHSGKVVEVAGASTALEAKVQQWENNNQICGQWKFIAPSTGLVTAYKDCNYTGFSGGFGIGDYTRYQMGAMGIREDDISSLRITQGYKAILYQDDNFGGATTEITSDNTCLNTIWNDKVGSMRILPNGVANVAGIYHLQNKNSGLFMDVWQANAADGANIVQGNFNGSTNQQFKFTHLGDGVYQVLAVHSNKSIDVDAIKTNDGANVQQWTYLASANQQFIVVPTGDGYYKLVAKHSGKIVEVAGAGMGNGDNVQQWSNNNQTCGQWKFKPLTSAGTGTGLAGNYFNGMNFETPKYSRTDANINFDWGTGAPNGAISADQFSVRWTGQLQPKYNGEYTFYVTSDNGRKLWINNQLIIDKWLDDMGENTGKITLTAGQKYDIRLEYFEENGGAACKLEWSSFMQDREVISATQLYANALPTINLITPANNQTFVTPAAINISTSAADTDGSVAKVEFYNGTVKLGEDVTSPFAYSWTNAVKGTYAITVRAYDNRNAVTVSAPVTVVVNDPVTTGIADDHIAAGLSIHPNPVENILYITASEELANAQIHIFDVQGKLVSSPAIHAGAIHVEDLHAGFYILEITGLSTKHVQRFIKK